MVDIYGAISMIVIGIIAIFIARMVVIERIVNQIIYVIGAILVLVGLILLVLSLIGVVI